MCLTINFNQLNMSIVLQLVVFAMIVTSYYLERGNRKKSEEAYLSTIKSLRETQK